MPYAASVSAFPFLRKEVQNVCASVFDLPWLVVCLALYRISYTAENPTYHYPTSCPTLVSTSFYRN